MTRPSFSTKALLLRVLLTGGLLFSLASTAQAQPKIATVDLRKIFELYYKTAQADAQLRERGTDAEKQYKGMLEDYQKANEDYKKLVESANDQAVSSEVREKRKKSAENKVQELTDIEKTLTQFKREKQATFEEQKKRMRDQIVREIREQINNRARKDNFTLVLDTSAESINQAPFILFTDGRNDLTDEILSQMNISAPPGSLDDDKDTKAKGDVKTTAPDQDKSKPAPKSKK
jgi:outer membrane protein